MESSNVPVVGGGGSVGGKIDCIDDKPFENACWGGGGGGGGGGDWDNDDEDDDNDEFPLDLLPVSVDDEDNGRIDCAPKLRVIEFDDPDDEENIFKKSIIW